MIREDTKVKEAVFKSRRSLEILLSYGIEVSEESSQTIESLSEENNINTSLLLRDLNRNKF